MVEVILGNDYRGRGGVTRREHHHHCLQDVGCDCRTHMEILVEAGVGLGRGRSRAMVGVPNARSLDRWVTRTLPNRCALRPRRGTATACGSRHSLWRQRHVGRSPPVASAVLAEGAWGQS
jgi:hypothetical protein